MHTHICILKGLRPMPPTRTLNTSRPPVRLQVTSGGPRNQPRNHSIVQAHPVRTIGVLGEVLEGSLGVPWRSPGASGILWGVARGPWGVPGRLRLAVSAENSINPYIKSTCASGVFWASGASPGSQQVPTYSHRAPFWGPKGPKVKKRGSQNGPVDV